MSGIGSGHLEFENPQFTASFEARGALAAVSAAIAQAGANIVEVRHERAFANAPSNETEVEFVLETRGAEHLRDVVAALDATGHHVAAPRART